MLHKDCCQCFRGGQNARRVITKATKVRSQLSYYLTNGTYSCTSGSCDVIYNKHLFVGDRCRPAACSGLSTGSQWPIVSISTSCSQSSLTILVVCQLYIRCLQPVSISSIDTHSHPKPLHPRRARQCHEVYRNKTRSKFQTCHKTSAWLVAISKRDALVLSAGQALGCRWMSGCCRLCPVKRQR